MFVFLLLFFCVCSAWGSSNEESLKEIVLDGKVYFAVQDRESLENGFCYARKEGATAQDILQDVYKARADVMCAKVYRGHEVATGGQTTSETVHFSPMHEYTLSVRAAQSFLHRCGLQNGYFCVDLEDLANFCLFLHKDHCADGLKVGLRLIPHSRQKFSQVAYGFGDALTKYRALSMVAPIVFFSSGRRGFTGAGEFLFQLERYGLKREKVSFFFTALKEQEYLDVCKEIAAAAYTVAKKEGFCLSLQYWAWVVGQCVEHVGCQRVHKGQVLFAQDPGNILTSWWFGVTGRFKDKKGKLDVLVGGPSDHMDDKKMAPYLARAYRLYHVLDRTLGVGCITGQENPEHMSDRAQHTLVCLDGPLFDFAKGFGESMQIKFGYKNVEFVEKNTCSVGEDRNPLIVGGCVQEDKENAAYFDLLFASQRTSRVRLQL